MKKYDNFIVHIPHASLDFPRFYNVDKNIMEEAIYVSDYLVDLFISPLCNNVVKFKYCRLFCDVERFKNDEMEEMSKYGMGVIYSKYTNGEELVTLEYINTYKSKIIKEYYDKHHRFLDKMTTKLIKKYKCCYIIDLHSYSDSFVENLFNKRNNPDICIGFSHEYVLEELVNNTIDFFRKNGYSVEENYPYEGSIIPNKYFNSDDKLYSLMIEINKRIYLDDNKVLNEEKYIKLKRCMEEYFEYLSEYIDSCVKI